MAQLCFHLLNHEGQVVVIHIDFQEAFDQLDHSNLNLYGLSDSGVFFQVTIQLLVECHIVPTWGRSYFLNHN